MASYDMVIAHICTMVTRKRSLSIISTSACLARMLSTSLTSLDRAHAPVAGVKGKLSKTEQILVQPYAAHVRNVSMHLDDFRCCQIYICINIYESSIGRQMNNMS